ncbi:hypothetical protein ACONUD_18940 [Microbulbifer harenosus]|uniref:Yip1 domain-containing protein n=1 Tax=Microbulbifer harenosus TaxID=2576840 RepID=A0ABY2UE66_9GAMM|nr:hypothetical protein [Microbulbifer harenosus]TLM75243.1 hypothetical protein FDY93_16250 [Microbulbifer harenosus]
MISQNEFFIECRLKIERAVSVFHKDDFLPSGGWRDYWIISLWWMLPAAAYVFVVEWFRGFRAVDYFDTAMSQGVSPELWNVIGVFGFTSLGFGIFTVNFPCLHTVFIRSANKLLLIAFDIGLLSFGIILSKVILAFGDAEITSWKTWFFGIGAFVFLPVVFALNTILWYLATIIHNQGTADMCSPIMRSFARLSGLTRSILGVVVITVPICFLLLER